MVCEINANTLRIPKLSFPVKPTLTAHNIMKFANVLFILPLLAQTTPISSFSLSDLNPFGEGTGPVRFLASGNVGQLTAVTYLLSCACVVR